MNQISQSRTSLVVEFSAESSLRSPLKLIKCMWSDLKSSGPLTWQLLKRDLQSRYRESFFGVIWDFLPPVIMSFGLMLADRANLVNLATTDIPYPLFVIFGTTLFQLFSAMVTGPSSALKAGKPLVGRVTFPREALFFSNIGASIFDFLLKMVIVLALFFILKTPFGPHFWLFPLAIVPTIVFGSALGLLLVPFSVLIPDVHRGVSVTIGYLFFLTPIVYPLPSDPLFRSIVTLNPITPLLLTAKEALLSTTFSMLPIFLVLSAISFALIFFVWILVSISMPHLIERMGS